MDSLCLYFGAWTWKVHIFWNHLKRDMRGLMVCNFLHPTCGKSRRYPRVNKDVPHAEYILYIRVSISNYLILIVSICRWNVRNIFLECIPALTATVATGMYVRARVANVTDAWKAIHPGAAGESWDLLRGAGVVQAL